MTLLNLSLALASCFGIHNTFDKSFPITCTVCDMGRLSYPQELDSPSRQLVLELARDLEQLRVHNTELKKVKAYERRSFYESLDRIDSELEAQHNEALDKVAKLHDQVLEEAEETLRVHQRAVEEENRRKEEEARKEAERIEREKAERLRREQEEAARREAERKAAEEARKKAEAEAERQRRAAQEEKERKEQERLEEENRKRQAEAHKAEQEAARLKAEAAQKSREEQQKKVGGARLTEEEINVQARYVELHQHLKKFRQYLKDEGKSNAVVKQNMGDMRRSIKKCVGQLREGKGTNKGQVRGIILFVKKRKEKKRKVIRDWLANQNIPSSFKKFARPSRKLLLSLNHLSISDNSWPFHQRTLPILMTTRCQLC